MKDQGIRDMLDLNARVTHAVDQVVRRLQDDETPSGLILIALLYSANRLRQENGIPEDVWNVMLAGLEAPAGRLN